MKPKQTLIDILGIVTLAVILLWACHIVSRSRYLRGIVDNDAVGYTTAARSLLDSRRIVAHIVYPSLLSQEAATKSVLYMPGYYYVLAAWYRLIGFGATQSILCSNALYVLSAVCTYLMGLRFYNRRTALLAALFFMIFPANLYFASTAMSEMAVVASAALALCAFVHLPQRWMAWLGPVLLLLPFLFRETGAFLALPMAVILLHPPAAGGGAAPTEPAAATESVPPPTGARARALSALIFLGLSIVLLSAAYISPLAAGRPSLLKLDVFVKQPDDAERIYRDALIAGQIRPTVGQTIRTLVSRFSDNTAMMVSRFDRQSHQFTVLVLLHLVLVVPVGLVWGILRRDGPAIAAGALLLVTLAFVCVFYTVAQDRPVRVAMFAFPLVALMEARLWTALFCWLQPRIPIAHRHWPQALAGAAVAASSMAVTFKGFNAMLGFDLADERGNALVEWLDHDDSTMIVAPHRIGIPYVSRHPSASYAFVPANRSTLDLLCRRYPVTMLIYDPDDALDLKPQDIAAQGLLPYRRVHLLDAHFTVYRKPAFPGEETTWKTEFEQRFRYPPRIRVRY
jgi:hypothetical protein